MDGHGVPIVVGTDSGLPNAIFDDFVTPLELLQERGFSAERILCTATAHAADVLGIATSTGRIEEDLDADLLVVDGDPRTDIQAARRLCLVVARGRRYGGYG